MKVDKQISIIQDTAERAQKGMNEAYAQGFRFLSSSTCAYTIPATTITSGRVTVIVTIIMQKPEALDEKKLEVTRVVHLEEDDNLVVHVPGTVSEKMRKHLVDSFKECFPKDRPVVVLENGMELGAIKRGLVKHIEQIWLECFDCKMGYFYDNSPVVKDCKNVNCTNVVAIRDLE